MSNSASLSHPQPPVSHAASHQGAPPVSPYGETAPSAGYRALVRTLVIISVVALIGCVVLMVAGVVLRQEDALALVLTFFGVGLAVGPLSVLGAVAGARALRPQQPTAAMVLLCCAAGLLLVEALFTAALFVPGLV